MDNKKTIIKEYLFTGESYNTIDECLKELFIDETFIELSVCGNY